MSDGQNGGNCFDAMRQKIKNPAPLRTSQLDKLTRDGAGFLKLPSHISSPRCGGGTT